jgi:hypothetical protein
MTTRRINGNTYSEFAVVAADPLPVNIQGATLTLDAEGVEIKNDVGNPIPVNDAGGSITVDGPLTDAELRATALPVSGPLTDTELRATALPVSGPLTDTELRATALPVSAAALPLPTGAATEAKQDTGNTSLGNIDADLGAPADAAASSDTGTFGLIALIKRGLQNWTTLLGRVPANLTVNSTRLLVDGSGVTQPVSGPLTDTQLRAAAVPVSGTINTLTGLDIPKHDNIALTYTGENLTAVAYKLGATTVATLTLAYTGSRLDSVTKS